jgi:polyisoprenoid-binding protein YceI
MRGSQCKKFGLWAVALILLAVLLSASAAPPHPQSGTPTTASEMALSLDPAQTKVHWTVDSTLHTVHGTFALKRGSMHFDPATGKASGEIIVDAASGVSGNGSRDKKMHREVLESARYSDVVFRPDRVEGRVLPAGSSTVQVHGIFVLRGKKHELSVPVQAELAGDHWKGTGKFSVPYIRWGLKNPSNFLLKVKAEVEIELEMAGNLTSGAN